MPLDVAEVWNELERVAGDGAERGIRTYRALGETAVGIRAAYVPRDRVLELLIEVPLSWDGVAALPSWRGMRFDVLPLSFGPRPESRHLRLYLEEHEHRSIFLTFCGDLVSALEGITDPAERVGEIQDCISRWNRFFERCGPEGLSPLEQRGLFAELEWMRAMLEGGVNAQDAVRSWKGCERAYHDFDLGGYVVEVKSTMTKEPRSVRISNERQLDDRGLVSLHLFAVTLHASEGGGVTLLDLVSALRGILGSSPSSLSEFGHRLVSAGYSESHAPRYVTSYSIKHAELFRVTQGFPRIVEVPAGTGELTYSVTLAACHPYLVDAERYLKELTGRCNG